LGKYQERAYNMLTFALTLPQRANVISFTSKSDETFVPTTEGYCPKDWMYKRLQRAIVDRVSYVDT
jgi:hypothetical protein